MISVMNSLETNQVSISEDNQARVSNESVNDSNSNDFDRAKSEIDEIRVLSGSERDGGDSRVLDGSQCRKIGDFVDSRDEVSSENGKSSEIDEVRVLSGSGREGSDSRVLDGTQGREIGGFVDSRAEVLLENGKSSKVGEAQVVDGTQDEPPLENGMSSEIDGTGVSWGLKREGDDSVGLSTEVSLENGLVNDGSVESSEIGEARVFTGLGRVEGDSRVLDGTRDLSKNDLDGDGGVESSDALNEVATPEASIVGNSEVGLVEGSIAGTSDGKHVSTGKNRKLQMDGAVGEFKLERRSDVGMYDVDVGGTRSMKVLDTAFEMGDMVWAKVKSHPWWPGHIFHEAFATSSVRRTRREGHVLVAFFGDSSYGWFHPLDLIPYDPNFTEKSQQTNARNFMNAVEESIDEASKRSALGLSCCCRNPRNFRSTNISGYLAVDVVDYDPNEVYSMSQIMKARESFRPSVTLSFIKQLAMAPKGDDSKSLDFIKQKATALAYRRSIFEEFDETYAQAFGHESVRKMPQPSTDKGPFRAPLSGPLVMADAFGDRKSSSKATTKPKDKSKREKYLFKRRAEAEELKITQTNQVYASSSPLSAYDDGSSDSAAPSYMLQKRNHSVTTNGASADQLPTSAHHMTTEDAPSGLNETIGTDIFGKRFSLDTTSSLQQSEPSVPIASEPTNVRHKTPDNHIRSITSDDSGLAKKKKKVAKRSADELKSEKLDITEKRKKKMRKVDRERSMEYFERPTPSSGGSASSREGSQVNNSKKEDGISNSVPHQGSLLLETVQDLPKMLSDLQGLALNPIHSSERNRPAIVRKLFLKFRSLVFRKASTSEPEPDDAPAEKHASASSKTASSSKPSKLSARPEDPTKGGRKRIPSERQEEMSVKRLKKIEEVKSLSAEKRALLKNTEMPGREGKAKVSSSQQPLSKSMKPEQHTNKLADRARRVEEPTFLMMKFQSGSSLPSLAELKARFARFGPLDTSLSRVFYKTNTCRVAFMYKQDAHVAYRYAVGNKSVFSNVKFMLKPVVAPEPQQPSGGKSEDLQIDPSSNLGSSAVDPQHAGSVTPRVNQQPGQQLKSCLKKPSGGDESMGPTNGSGIVRAPRVRFNMDENKDGSSINREGGETLMESGNAIPSSEDGTLCSLPSSSVAMDVSINHRFTSSVPMQRPPFPHPQHNVGDPQRNDFDYNLNATTELSGVAPSPLVSLSRVPPLPPPPSMDISQQMMNLLTRCHDVVNSVNNILGYVPYHPL